LEKQIGPYQIVRLIGTGGMGSVYEAFHPQIERRAAIKTLAKELQQDPEFVQRFFNEARAANIINHPSVVNVYDFGTTEEGAPYIVMEYLEGETLRQRMTKGGSMDPMQAMKTFRQIASGLQAAHAKKIVHRDLKPGNVLIVADTDGPDGERPKILDFGIAKLATSATAQPLTRMGVSMGTPAYMSPELCRDAREVTDRSDVYSLGVMLFEALSGEHPFVEAMKADSAMMASHIGQMPPALESKVPGLPAELLGLVNRMLAKQPDSRPSAAEIAATLGRLSGSVTGLIPILDTSPSHLPSLPMGNPTFGLRQDAEGGFSMLLRPLSENRGVAIGAGLLLLVGLLGIGIVMRLLLSGQSSTPQQVRWSIDSEPQGAEVFDAIGQSLGQTPLFQVRTYARSVDVLSIRKEGYAEFRIPCDRSKDLTERVVLTALAANPKPKDAEETETQNVKDIGKKDSGTTKLKSHDKNNNRGNGKGKDRTKNQHTKRERQVL